MLLGVAEAAIIGIAASPCDALCHGDVALSIKDVLLLAKEMIAKLGALHLLVLFCQVVLKLVQVWKIPFKWTFQAEGKKT